MKTCIFCKGAMHKSDKAKTSEGSEGMILQSYICGTCGYHAEFLEEENSN